MRARSWMAALALVVGTSFAVGRAMPVLDDESGRRQRKSRGRRESQIAFRQRWLQAAGNPRPSPLSLIWSSPGWAPKAATFKSSRVMRAASSARFTRSAAKTINSSPPTAMPASSFVTLSFAAPTGRSRSRSRSAKKARRPGPSIAVSGSKPNPTRTTGRRLLAAPTFTCYLSSPSKLAKSDESRTRR